jgi:site-specific DNA-methyltransferase (adenine-specific)
MASKMQEDVIYNCDCIEGMKDLPDESIDCVLTDPPYLYLKNQKLDRQFDEKAFFEQVKRVLKPNAFIILFGRGTSFYRWNTMLADLGFTFKEEIVWNKGYCTSPLMNLSRVHETVSMHTKGNGTVKKCKIPYLEMKGNDIPSILQDIKRMSVLINNPKSLKAVKDFLANNQVPLMRSMSCGSNEKTIIRTDFNKNENNGITGASSVKCEKCVNVMQSVEFGMKEKSIIRTDREDCDTFTKYGVNSDKRKIGDRCTNVMQGIEYGMNEKSIIRTDYEVPKNPRNGVTCEKMIPTGDRCTDMMQSIEYGLNEKSVIKETPDHYKAIHPTQKPTRLLERLMNLVCDSGALVLDPFSGSGSTAVACMNTGRHYIGYEIDKEYYDASMKRIKEVEPKLQLM